MLIKMQCRQISGYVNWAVRSVADLDVQMMAVERVHEYASLPQESKQKIS